MKPTTASIFTLLVDNEFGVLTRVTALIRRSGWNIRSLAAAETENTDHSRLTICLECRHYPLEHVLEHLSTLNCVHEVTVYTPETQIARELALFRLKDCDEAFLASLCEKHGASLLEQSADSVYLSVVAEPNDLDQLLQDLSGHGLSELVRTGAIALARKKED